jgi:hypothetical protein
MNDVKRTVAAAALTAIVVSGAPAVAGSIVRFARNAHMVDGKHAVGAGASLKQRRGKLVATGRSGRLPNNIIAKAPNASRLDGRDSSAYARLAQLRTQGEINAGANPVHWTRLKGVPGGFEDGADALGPRAYAHVDATGTAAFRYNIPSLVPAAGRAGVYCFTLDFEAGFVQVTPDLSGSWDARQAGAHPYASLDPVFVADYGCPDGSDAVVAFKSSVSGDQPGGPFFVAFM